MIHQSGPMDSDGRQKCTRCGLILTDIRGLTMPDSQHGIRPWPTDASIDVSTDLGVRFSGVTIDPPDCEPIG